MSKFIRTFFVAAALCAAAPMLHADETIGQRPYEMEWAGRTSDIYPPLVDFENLRGWKAETQNATATFGSSREQQLWGNAVGKLTYRANANAATDIRLLPPAPLRLSQPWNAISCWIYGNNISGREGTPSVSIAAIFVDSKGVEVLIPLTRVNWKEWFVPYRVLTADQQQQLASGAAFNGFHITGGTNLADRVLYFDNFAAFAEKRPDIPVPARPQRGIAMLPGQSAGFNTGADKLPFPNREKTILPDNGTANFTTRIRQDGSTLLFEYRGADGNLTYRLEPQSGDWSDISARWNDGAWFQPLAGGGVLLHVGGQAVAPEKAVHKSTQLRGAEVVSDWTLSAGGVTQDVSYIYRLQNKSLVIDTIARGGNVAEVQYGRAEKTRNPRLVWNPFYAYNSLDDRPGVVVMGDAAKPLFLGGNTDWYLSNASQLWGKRSLQNGAAFYNGGTRYIAKTDGRRNDCYERFFVTIAPTYEEVLPNIPNPKSPWRHVTGTRVWTVRGASANRKNDYAHFARLHRYGMTELVITDHETMWRDGEESFTFRTKAAPGKGGDEAQREYSRFLQEKLGYLYGPYNNYTDFAPVNEFWTPDLISRTPDGQLQTAWRRCYAPKPALAVQYAEKLAPIIEAKFEFSTAYCDVHTAVTPWIRTDYDARVPGAGTFAATFYSYGEIMLLQKQAWGGPVYSEGGHHWFYAGLTDGNYGQDSHAQLYKNPWLVDFNLRKIHPLNNNFGMGNPEMFWGRGNVPTDAAAYDRFFAATIAFGHTGFLISPGTDPTLSLRSYYLPLALHSRYALADVQSIRYADGKGQLFNTSQALQNEAYRRSQIVTRYDDGTVTVVNGSTEHKMRVRVVDREIVLPPNGYTGWSRDGKVQVFSGAQNGHRADYVSSEEYLYIDGRGQFARFEKAAGDGLAICRILSQSEFEIIPVKNADAGFAISATSAVALDETGQEIGAAQTRVARGLTYVVPVEGAFSYRIKGTLTAPRSTLGSAAFKVLPGQNVTLDDARESTLQIPTDAKPGAHFWAQRDGQWIDFLVIPLTSPELSVSERELRVKLQSNLDRAADFAIDFENQRKVLRLDAGASREATFALPPPTRRESRIVAVEIRSGETRQTVQRVLTSDLAHRTLAPLPQKWESGLGLRGKAESAANRETGGRALINDAMSSGGVVKGGIFMHPPYQGGIGYAFARYAPFALPNQPVMFRASVGKQDGGAQGDGILFKVAVVEGERQTIVAEQTVTTFEWKPIEADLSRWAGKTIQLQLIADPGPNDDTTADWACWAEMRLETKDKTWQRRLSDDLARYQREAAPFPANNLTAADLRAAKSGRLHYQGLGVSGGSSAYAISAELNGEKSGFLAPASGREAEGVWADAAIPLTPNAIRNLDAVNTLALSNPDQDYFAIRRFWIELELADGRKVSSQISATTFTQPPPWPHGAGVKVPFGEKVQVDIVF